MKNSKLKNDIILISSLVLAACALFLTLRIVRRPGGEAVVSVDGETYAVLPLDTDTTVPVETEYGINTVVIRSGAVSVASADCPDKLCVRQGEIRYGGESIVCLPHKVIVTVRGVDSAVDAVAR